MCQTDLLEPVNHLLDQARRNLSSNSKAGDFILSSLQDYAPPPQRYDCIWLQWCVLYLTDDDCVSFLKRCKPNLNPNVSHSFWYYVIMAFLSRN